MHFARRRRRRRWWCRRLQQRRWRRRRRCRCRAQFFKVGTPPTKIQGLAKRTLEVAFHWIKAAANVHGLHPTAEKRNISVSLSSSRVYSTPDAPNAVSVQSRPRRRLTFWQRCEKNHPSVRPSVRPSSQNSPQDLGWLLGGWLCVHCTALPRPPFSRTRSFVLQSRKFIPLTKTEAAAAAKATAGSVVVGRSFCLSISFYFMLRIVRILLSLSLSLSLSLYLSLSLSLRVLGWCFDRQRKRMRLRPRPGAACAY